MQIAKPFGAEVTGVCSSGSVDMVRSIGADHVIDYTQEGLTKGASRYDSILDNVANHSTADTRCALTPTGRLQSNGGGHSDGRWLGFLGAVIKSAVSSTFAHQQLGPSVKFPNQQVRCAPSTRGRRRSRAFGSAALKRSGSPSSPTLRVAVQWAACPR